MDLRSQQEKRSGSGGGWTVLQLVRLGETKGQRGAGLEEGSRRLVREAETATLELRCHRLNSACQPLHQCLSAA